MSEKKLVLLLENVDGGYGDSQILTDINMEVHQGEIVVIIGPNGAGKSTAMKSVFGLLNLTKGKVVLNGKDITNMPPEKVVHEGVCYVPQTANIFPSLTVQENLEMGAFIRNDDFKPRMQEIFELFPPLYEKRAQPAGTLSGGQRQMVAMGKALMLEPQILLLDEPTAGLSPLYQSEIFEIVKQVHAHGTPILMVEQNAKQALAIADRGYVLVDGKNKYHDTGAALLADPEVGEMFLGGGKAATISKRKPATANAKTKTTPKSKSKTTSKANSKSGIKKPLPKKVKDPSLKKKSTTTKKSGA
jgi:branched-chain amino acid transport system ATP-binding protein